MIFQAVLNNRNHPEIGVVTISFPIPEEEYKNCLELLAPMGIDDPVEQQCNVVEIQSGYSTLSQMEGTLVNLDELDYLAKRLDSFCDGEDAQFEGMAHLLGLHNIRDFINLTFCCQQATVISDFSNLKDIGQTHYMNTHGGGAPVEIIKNLDAEKVARDLIASGQGKVTPYGVVYDNGMELEQFYKGTAFPPYLYKSSILNVSLTPSFHPESDEFTFIQLPLPKDHLDRLLLRGEFNDGDDFLLEIEWDNCPSEAKTIVEKLDFIDTTCETVRALNQMCKAIERLSFFDLKKLDAVLKFIEPEYPFQIQRLAENLDKFDFIPEVKTPADYGRYMIEQSGHFEYDENLEEYYDFEKYGNDHIARLKGQFNEHGYVSYHGTLSFEALMMEDPSEPGESEGMQMGGMA